MLYIVINLRTRPIHLTTFWVKIRGLFNPTLIDRVNKLMTNNIRSTYRVSENEGQIENGYNTLKFIVFDHE